MDPTANLAMQRALVKQIVTEAAQPHDYRDNTTECLCAHATELGELVEALDDWISNGGFLPSQWPAPTLDDTGVRGTIRLEDGSTSEFQVGDSGYQQWGASTERLGRTVDLVGAIEAAFMEEGEGR